MNIVKFAKEIIDMNDRIIELEHENFRLRQVEMRYEEFLNSSIQSSQELCGNMLKLGLKLAEEGKL